jgi:DNA-binding MarR family transcriptional regulator
MTWCKSSLDNIVMLYNNQRLSTRLLTLAPAGGKLETAMELSLDAVDKPEQPGADPARGVSIGYGLLDERLGYWTRRAQIGIFQDFFQAFRQMELRPAQYSTLTIIERNPGLTQTQVADALGIKKANFVALIRELERRKLVRRRPDRRDKRSYGLFLSEAAVALMPELHAASEAHERRMRKAIGEERYQSTLASLRDLAAALDRMPVDNDPDSFKL